jgi:hypothetical protein
MADEYVDITLSIRKEDLDRWHVYRGEDFVGWKVERTIHDAVATKYELFVVLPSYDGVEPEWPEGTVLNESAKPDTL